MIGVHLRSPTRQGWLAAQRNQQLRSPRSASGPSSKDLFVVAGDFNVTPYSPILIDWLERTGLTEARF